MPQLRKNIITFEEIPLDKKEWIVTKSNPSYWKNDGVRSKFEYVYAPSFPEIENAYEKDGKQIYREDGNVVTETPVVESGNADVLDITETQEQETQESNEDVLSAEDFQVETPHWSELSWPKMRSVASTYSEEPIKSKEQAEEVLRKAEQEGKI